MLGPQNSFIGFAEFVRLKKNVFIASLHTINQETPAESVEGKMINRIKKLSQQKNK